MQPQPPPWGTSETSTNRWSALRSPKGIRLRWVMRSQRLRHVREEYNHTNSQAGFH